MRAIMLSLAMVLVGFNASATSPKVTELVKQLAQNNPGMRVHVLQGKTAATLLKHLALKVNKVEEEDFNLVNFPKSIPGADEKLNQYGLSKINQFMDLLMSQWQDEIRNGADFKMTSSEAWDTARELQERGVAFGYTTDGGVVCGVTFPSPLVIDEEHSTVYEILLVDGPC
jgi:hypothetical protein